MSGSSLPTRLDPSPLGTQEHWDNLYKSDLDTHEHNPEHVGQVWFDESGAEAQTIQFLENAELDLDPTSCTVLDLGTGNGNMLMSLREEGWAGHLWGVDYSPDSVKLARRIIGQRTRQLIEGEDVGEEVNPKRTDFDDAKEPALDIHVLQHDILAPWPPAAGGSDKPPDRFDLVHDKGTFDAISLSEDGPDACVAYAAAAEKLIKPGGYLLITSCNWTEDELEKWISGSRPSMQKIGSVKYKTFKFGGKEGGVLSGLCWRKGSGGDAEEA